MEERRTRDQGRILLLLVVAYAIASLIHFVHNAVYLHDYPNMPRSITVTDVYAVWIAQATVGCVGYGLYRRGWPRVGLLVIGIYATFGLAGLDHYVLAPPSAHSVVMNLTIGFEVIAAATLFVVVAYRLFAQQIRRPAPTG
jgi:hypothetical protein